MPIGKCLNPAPLPPNHQLPHPQHANQTPVYPRRHSQISHRPHPSRLQRRDFLRTGYRGGRCGRGASDAGGLG